MRPTNILLAGFALLIAVDAGLGSAPAPRGGLQVQLPHVFTAGSPARAGEVNANFDALGVAVESRATEVDARLDALEGGLGSAANTAFVSASGGDFTSVAAALASITGASDSNPYVVRVGPGVYEETTLVDVPPLVTLVGAGPEATVIQGDRTSSVQGAASAVLRLNGPCAVRALSVVNTGATDVSNAIIGTSLGRDARLMDV